MTNTVKKRIPALLVALCALCACAACSRTPAKPNLPTDSSAASSGDGIDMSYQPGLTELDLGEVETFVDEDGTPYVTPQYEMTGRTVSLLSHWDADTPDSIHMVSYLRKYGGPQVKFITAPYAECGTKLQSMVLAENAPDLYKVRDGDVAGIMRQGLFTDLTGLIDWDSRNWIDLKPFLDTVRYNGQILIAPEFNSNYFIWYNKNIFSERGVEDPIELYDKGEWTLDKFDSICKRLTVRQDGAVQLYGFGYDHTWMRQVFAMFDAQLSVKSGDGYVNTVGSDAVTDAISYLNEQINVSRVTCKQDKALPYFASGKLAMLWYGNWLSMSAPFAEMNLSGTIDFVPAPTNSRLDLGPRQDYALSGHAIPIGAKDTEAALAFIEIFNFYKQTPELDTVSTNAQCELNNWSTEQFLRMRKPRYYENKYTFVELSDTWDFILDSVENNRSWLSVREMYSKQIDLVIEGISNSSN
ncbi:MAG: extracellular solute-binding protein [Clostridia bacterium]|nr:extracellular solute-binding protein [Clostridia bacterium]